MTEARIRRKLRLYFKSLMPREKNTECCVRCRLHGRVQAELTQLLIELSEAWSSLQTFGSVLVDCIFYYWVNTGSVLTCFKYWRCVHCVDKLVA